MNTKYTPPIIIYMHHHPTRFACIVLALVIVPVWWLTGDYSPW